MKKFLLLIILILCVLISFCPKTMAEDVFKITSANFDNSNSFIVLTANDNTTEPIAKEVKMVKLSNPNRIYFDLDSTILTTPKQDWTFNYGAVKQVKIAQFSTEPLAVRVVITLDENYDTDNIKLVRFKNNIFIKFKNSQLLNDYFQNSYRDEHASASDFYEYTTVMSPNDNNVIEQIQDAAKELVKKDIKLNSKYYLNNVTVKQDSILLNGFGSTTIERPMILSNPSRIVFDIPNAVVNQEIRNKEFQINQTDRVKVGQFSVNKARIVIATENVNDYIPIFSQDNQSIIIGNHKKMNTKTLTTQTTDAIAYSIEQDDAQNGSLILSFNKPVIHGIERTSNQFVLYMFNAMKYNEGAFKETVLNSIFDKAKVELLPQVGLKLSIPIENSAVFSSYLSVDGKNLKVKVKEVKPVTPIRKPVTVKPSKPPRPHKVTPEMILANNKRKIVLDAGHGGSDVGAMAGEIYEKDITLDVTKRVHAILTKKGYQIELTRSDDRYLSLQERCDFSEAYEPDIFVSIHVNSSINETATGVETHYYHQESMELAQKVQSSLASSINTTNRGLFKSKFYVINHTTRPAVLVEIGFISNEEEREQLTSEDRKQDTAQAIADGIDEYLQEH